MKRRGIIISLAISFTVIAYSQRSESEMSTAILTLRADTLLGPVENGQAQMQPIPVKSANAPVGNIIPLPLKPVMPEQKHDILSPKPDTLSSSSLAPVSISDTIAINNISLPQGAKDTTTLSFRDTDLGDIFRAMAARHWMHTLIVQDQLILEKTDVYILVILPTFAYEKLRRMVS